MLQAPRAHATHPHGVLCIWHFGHKVGHPTIHTVVTPELGHPPATHQVRHTKCGVSDLEMCGGHIQAALHLCSGCGSSGDQMQRIPVCDQAGPCLIAAGACTRVTSSVLTLQNHPGLSATIPNIYRSCSWADKNARRTCRPGTKGCGSW